MADSQRVSCASRSRSGSTVSHSTHSESVASVSDSEHEFSYASSSLGDIQPPSRKKIKSMGTGKFRSVGVCHRTSLPALTEADLLFARCVQLTFVYHMEVSMTSKDTWRLN